MAQSIRKRFVNSKKKNTKLITSNRKIETYVINTMMCIWIECIFACVYAGVRASILFGHQTNWLFNFSISNFNHDYVSTFISWIITRSPNILFHVAFCKYFHIVILLLLLLLFHFLFVGSWHLEKNPAIEKRWGKKRRAKEREEEKEIIIII